MADLSSSPHHRLAVRGQLGGLHLDLAATFHAPWTVLFGPSGSGKSTLLRAMAGLEPGLHVTFERHTPASGWTTLADTRRPLAPEKRQLAYAPQGAGLFPHLTVRGNVAFPHAVRQRRRGSASTAYRVDEALALLGIESLSERHPHELSGGERQRVGLARALAVPDARLALLDEPFAGIDRALRDDLLPRIQAWFAALGIPAISVTHDVDEALLYRADVVRLGEGRNAAQGPAYEVLAPEIHRLAALLNRSPPRP